MKMSKFNRLRRFRGLGCKSLCNPVQHLCMGTFVDLAVVTGLQERKKEILLNTRAQIHRRS